jgi:peptide/nickel transport system ATP-binding protein
LRRPFITLMGKTQAEADVAAAQLLASVRLPASYLTVRPAQLSGGEKQRVAIARAFATTPELLLADEPVSSLDVSVQAMILSLMDELQESNHSAMLFISHDLAVVGYLADKIAVMYAGQLMEVARAAELFEPPCHPYTEALLTSVPLIDPTVSQQSIRLEGDVPSQIDIPGGCPFHPRCPRYLGDICREQTPPWQETERGDLIFCHIPLADLMVQQRRVFRLGKED